MIIGVPKEVKTEEYRVGALPMAVAVLTKAGHQVLVQTTAGNGSGFTDEEYIEAGATMVKTAEEVWNLEMDVNAKGNYLVTRPVVPHMITARYGKIVNASFICGKQGTAEFCSYTASWAADRGVKLTSHYSASKGGSRVIEGSGSRVCCPEYSS